MLVPPAEEQRGRVAQGGLDPPPIAKGSSPGGGVVRTCKQREVSLLSEEEVRKGPEESPTEENTAKAAPKPPPAQKKRETVKLVPGVTLVVECPKCTYEYTLNDRGVPSGRRVATEEGDK